MSTATEKEITEPGWSFLRSPRWLGYYALIIVFSIVCVFLGNWQFDRRDQARAEIARIDSNYDAPAISIDEALPNLEHFELDNNKWQPVILKGEYSKEPFLVRNRVSQQGVGSNLIYPLVLTDGSVFFVDRGWIPVNAAAEIPDDIPSPVSGEVEVTVRLRESEQKIANREAVGRTVGSINLPELAEMIDAPAYKGAYGQLISEAPDSNTGVLAPRPERDEGPHLSYALQWYVFIVIVIGGAWYAATLEWRSLNSSEDRKRKQIKNQRLKQRPRKLSDAEEEDAYLDAES